MRRVNATLDEPQYVGVRVGVQRPEASLSIWRLWGHKLYLSGTSLSVSTSLFEALYGGRAALAPCQPDSHVGGLTGATRQAIVNLMVHYQFAALGDPTRLAIVERLARG